MKTFLRVSVKAVKWFFIVFFVYLTSLFFREERLPRGCVSFIGRHLLPENLVLHADFLSFGFRSGLHLRDFRLYDSSQAEPQRPVVSASAIDVNVWSRQIRVEDLCYPRLPDGYYQPGNVDRNQRVEGRFPALGCFSLTLVRPDVLAVRPSLLTCVVEVTERRIDFKPIHLDWPDRDRKMSLEGFCFVDLDRQEVAGTVRGLARQAHIRPLLVAVDVPVSLPYMDAFTEVPTPCPASCSWKVDLVRNDFDLWLDLSPDMGKYNGVPMKKADGKIHVHNCTRNNCLNYKTTVGPISAVDTEGRSLDGTVTILGTNGYNTVDVSAKSLQPLADVLKIGGFTGDYVGSDVIGTSECELQFRFPRAMSNNYEVLNGKGRVKVTGGHLMRLKGFKGLIDAMPSVAPAVTWFSDSTDASCDYVISNGVLKTDNIYVEGTCFSIKMFGELDAVRNTLDFTARVQFAKKDSVVGQILHPLAWPFTKMLLEFRMTGVPGEPKWSYVSVIDRVMEAVK